MAKTYVQEGNVINYLNGGATTLLGGALVRIGAILAVVLADILAGAVGTVATVGVWELPKVAATAVAAGDKLDFVALTADLDVGIVAAATAVAGDLSMGAVAIEASAAGAATVKAYLLPGVGSAI